MCRCSMIIRPQIPRPTLIHRFDNSSSQLPKQGAIRLVIPSGGELECSQYLHAHARNLLVFDSIYIPGHVPETKTGRPTTL